MLLCLVENAYPSIGNAIAEKVYPGLWAYKLRYHLGGAPFFYLYRDLPNFNINLIFNTVGAALIFSTTLIASILFLFKIRLLHIGQRMLDKLKHFMTAHRESRPQLEAEPEEKKNDKVIEPEKTAPFEAESDFLRFVKLRIPSSNIQEGSLKGPEMNSAGPDMLGIRPEKNLKVRPSMTRKEQQSEEAEAEKITTLDLPDEKEAFKKPVEVQPTKASR